MLKLLIADDERVIRETISRIIPWENFDIELAGLAQNGLEAYDMILDYSPDIVLTDIKMPGMDGLELIKRISGTELNTQFIILSGYGEFEYAKEAMKYGVRHYILKPCNEQQILESVREVASDCCRRKQELVQKSRQSLLTNIMQYNIIGNILSECVAGQAAFPEILRPYQAYMDFSASPYHLLYVYYLEYKNLNLFLARLKEYYKQNMPQIALHGAYVKNTLVLFFRDYAEDYSGLEAFLSAIPLPDSSVSIQLKACPFPNLARLLETVSRQLKRYSSLYTINQFQPFYTCNYHSFSMEALALFGRLLAGEEMDSSRLWSLLEGIDDLPYFKQTAASLLMEGSLHFAGASSARLTEWLTDINQCSDLSGAKQLLAKDLQAVISDASGQSAGLLSAQVCQYVQSHLSDSSMTLKEIAENHLYMNVDYVSRKFQKETGRKFSDYLAEARIRAAKEWMARGLKVQEIAELVGCGNNPHYFSQLFKKKTGLTPSAYMNRYSPKAPS